LAAVAAIFASTVSASGCGSPPRPAGARSAKAWANVGEISGNPGERAVLAADELAQMRQLQRLRGRPLFRQLLRASPPRNVLDIEETLRRRRTYH